MTRSFKKSIATSYCEQQGKHQTPQVTVSEHAVTKQHEEDKRNEKEEPLQYRYKDRYVDADGCSNFCAVGLFLKHQTDRK